MIIIRHNEVWDFTASILAECYKDVRIEPDLTPLTGEVFPKSSITTDDARVDVAARGVWVKGQMAFFDVRVFNPTAKSYLNSDLSVAHRVNEPAKKHAHNRRVQIVDQASFSPRVFPALEAWQKTAKLFIEELLGNLLKRETRALVSQ